MLSKQFIQKLNLAYCDSVQFLSVFTMLRVFVLVSSTFDEFLTFLFWEILSNFSTDFKNLLINLYSYHQAIY
jgi:hypothetical protein